MLRLHFILECIINFDLFYFIPFIKSNDHRSNDTIIAVNSL